MFHFQFWQRWLFILGLAFVAGGLGLALFSQTPPLVLLLKAGIDPAFWRPGEVTEAIGSFQHLSYGIIGSEMAVWGIFMAYLARRPFRNRERWAWSCLLVTTVVWFLPETAISLHSNVPVNVAANLAVLLLVLVPLLATRKAFWPGDGSPLPDPRQHDRLQCRDG